tara:strand:+ start:8812 stop:9003 length:192 start_codon:yes stop_codon:yes gene_type:complete
MNEYKTVEEIQVLLDESAARMKCLDMSDKAIDAQIKALLSVKSKRDSRATVNGRKRRLSRKQK